MAKSGNYQTLSIRTLCLLSTAALPATAMAGLLWKKLDPPTGLLSALLPLAACVVLAFIGQVARRVEARWVERLTSTIDAVLVTRLSSFGGTYRRQMMREHQFIDMRGLGTQAPITPRLEQVFVDLGLEPRAIHRVSNDPLQVDDHIGINNRRPIWHFLDEIADAPIAIVGPAGCGKTTLIRHAAVRCCRTTKLPLPIVLYVRKIYSELAESQEVSLVGLVRASWGTWGRYEPEGWLERQLERGRCLVMLDGLDEVGDQAARATAITWVNRQVNTYHRCRFILTSRPYGYGEHPLPSAVVLRVRPLSQNQIDEFVRSWYLEIESRNSGLQDSVTRQRAEAQAKDLLARLRTPPVLTELAANPLLLTMMVNVHSYRGALPGSRSDLYSEIFQVFLGKRQAAKGIDDSLRADQKELILRSLALRMMMANKRSVGRAEAEEAISDILCRASAKLTPLDFLMLVEHSSGLFIEHQAGFYSFAHLTFQEYLTAMELKERRDGLDVLMTRILDPWWREVILLYAARADVRPILDRCLRTPTPYSAALALDIVDEAQQVEPGHRQWAISVLNSGSEPSRPDLYGVRLGATLAKKLRHTASIPGTDVSLCRQYITPEELTFGLNQAGLCTWVDDGSLYEYPESTVADRAVVGITAHACAVFCNWLTKALDDGRSYRPPTRSEFKRLGVLLPAWAEATFLTSEDLAHPTLPTSWQNSRLSLISTREAHLEPARLLSALLDDTIAVLKAPPSTITTPISQLYVLAERDPLFWSLMEAIQARLNQDLHTCWSRSDGKVLGSSAMFQACRGLLDLRVLLTAITNIAKKAIHSNAAFKRLSMEATYGALRAANPATSAELLQVARLCLMRLTFSPSSRTVAPFGSTVWQLLTLEQRLIGAARPLETVLLVRS